MSSVMAIFVKFRLMQISKIFYFFLFVTLISVKVTKFLVEKISTSQLISKKPHGGGWGDGKHPPSAFRVNDLQCICKVGHLF